MKIADNIFRATFFCSTLLLLIQCKTYEEPSNTKDLATESLANKVIIPEFWEASNDTTKVSDNWYKNFNDKTLESLVEEAIDTSNLSINYQLALIEQSIAQIDLSESNKNVQIGYSGDYGGVSSTLGTNNYNVGTSGGISWEADLWGKIEAGVLAADENLKAAIYNYSFTRQSIAATTSKLYFLIGTLNQGLQIGQDFITVNDRIKELLKIREEVGIIDMKEVYLIKAQISSINNIIERYKNEIQITTRSLEVVLGRYPENKLVVQWTPDNLAPIYEIGSPFQLIDRRPDLKRNAAIVRSNFFLEEQAKLTKYPSLVLSANIGYSTVEDLIFGTAASFFGPIYSGGALDGKIATASAEQKKSLMQYGMSILNAFKEVETSLSSQTYLLEQQKHVQNAIDESKNAYELMVKQYTVGRVGLFEVTQIQMEWLIKELDLVKINGEIYQQRVQLYLALGGNITKYE